MRWKLLRPNTLRILMRDRICPECLGQLGARWCFKCGFDISPIMELLTSLGEAGPMYRNDDQDTSQEAAESFTQKRLSDIQADVLMWFRKVNKATDEELEDHFRNKYRAQTTVSKRRTDLVRLGFLRDSGERRYNSNMRRMIVWELESVSPTSLKVVPKSDDF